MRAHPRSSRTSHRCAELYLASPHARRARASSTTGSRTSSARSAPTRSAGASSSSRRRRRTAFCRSLGTIAGRVRAQIEVGDRRAPSLLRPSARAGSGCPSAPTSPGLDAELARAGVRYFVRRHPRRDARDAAAASTACTRRSPARRASPPSAATPTAPRRSGARTRATPAIPGTATSTATSASTCRRAPSGAVLPPTGRACRPGLKYHRDHRARPTRRSRTIPTAPRERVAGARGALRRRAPAAGRTARRARWTARRSSSAPTTPSSSATGGSRARTGSTPSCAGSPPRPGSTAIDACRVTSTATPSLQRATPAASTWGWQGLPRASGCSDANDWIYPPPPRRRRSVCSRLCRRYPAPTGDWRRRALTQALRELLLAQASDWAFMMAREHHGRVRRASYPGSPRSLHTTLRRGRARHARRRAPGALEDADTALPHARSTASSLTVASCHRQSLPVQYQHPDVDRAGRARAAADGARAGGGAVAADRPTAAAPGHGGRRARALPALSRARVTRGDAALRARQVDAALRELRGRLLPHDRPRRSEGRRPGDPAPRRVCCRACSRSPTARRSHASGCSRSPRSTASSIAAREMQRAYLQLRNRSVRDGRRIQLERELRRNAARPAPPCAS